MSLQACAEIVQRGDPDRFAAAMAAPVEARRVLFPLYAFNVEVARAPWVTEEPMIAEMRLQWWRDALEEIGDGKQVRKHEVSTPLADVLNAPLAQSLDRLVQARRWDIYRDAFDDTEHFDHYLRMTGGMLMWVAAHLLGASPDTTDRIFALGRATALVRFLKAVPALEERGRIPLVDGRPESIAALAESALESLPNMNQLRSALPRAAHGAVLEAWETQALLKQILRRPTRVADGAIGLSEFRKRSRLIRWAL